MARFRNPSRFAWASTPLRLPRETSTAMVQDFAVANEGDDSISIFLGDGTGKFTAATNSPFVFARQLMISTTTLPDCVLNAAYTAALRSTGGTGAITWTLATGTLPAGLTLNPTT